MNRQKRWAKSGLAAPNILLKGFFEARKNIIIHTSQHLIAFKMLKKNHLLFLLLSGLALAQSCQKVETTPPDNGNNNNNNNTTTCTGRIKTLRRGTTIVAQFFYDTQGRLVKNSVYNDDGSFNRMQRLSYSTAGDIITNVDSTAATVNKHVIQYDANHRAISGVLYSSQSGQTNTKNISYRYNSANKLIEQFGVTLVAGGLYVAKDSISYTYTPVGKISTIKAYSEYSFSPGWTPLITANYSYDSAGNGIGVQISGSTTTYTIDPDKPYPYPLLYKDGKSLFFYTSLANDDMFLNKKTVSYSDGSATESYSYTYNPNSGCLTQVDATKNGTTKTTLIDY